MHTVTSIVLNLMPASNKALKSPKIIMFNEDESGYWIKTCMAAEVSKSSSQ